ncbi:hypothetical protein LGQ02_12705 [Bacillus shivajii]|uniref:MotE family protein n=1 Tax=Bacillus shivajii TaxID=1983719 RepID=UPI001CFA806B|nr:hypothetical protein [Bacillus shivajii]UCZ51723.1 hypothetical protein LGQ02_12705 [Bacillus shivajii]
MSENKKTNKLQMFFMVVFIPAIFAIILALVLLYYMGINVSENVQQAFSALPFIDSEVEDEDESSMEERFVQLEHENENYLTQIEQLEYELSMKDEEINQLQLEIESLIQIEESEEESPNERTGVNDVVQTIENMTASRAANIISELSDEEAVMYLRLMSVDTRSQILSRMDAERAAEIISDLSN